MANGLSWGTAAKIAAREMRHTRGKFLFVILSVAIGVAALTGVRGFSASFRATLLDRARSIMAADLAARTNEQPTPNEMKSLEEIRAGGVQTTTVTEMMSMAASPSAMNPLLVSLKAGDPALYPFYGEITLAPAMSLKTALGPGSVAVGDDLLLRTGLHVGDDVRVGGQTFRIAATVVDEPDRLSGNFEAGPRVLISGYYGFGNLGDEALLDVIVTRLRAAYPGGSIDVLSADPAATSARLNVDATPRMDLGAVRRAIERSDVVLSGGGGLLGGSGPIAAVMEKELRTVLRSPPLLYAVGGPLVMVLIISGLLRGGGSGNPFPLALPVCVAYALLGFMQLMFNNLGAEGAGIQLLFLSPTPIRTVLLAKNLFHAGLFGLAAVLAGILTSLRLGRPDGMVMAATLAWALFALPVNLAAGNVFSLAMPHRLNLGRMMRQRGSQASNLLSLLIQLGLLGVSAGVFWLCWFVDRPWLAVPIFLVAAVAAVRVWLRGLENADDLANRRRESLIATLMKTE